MDFSINDIHGDVVDYDHKVIRMIQVDKITSKMLISKPLVQTADYDPNSLSLGVTFDILSPEISINYEQFDVIKNIIDSMKNLEIGDKDASPQKWVDPAESNQQINSIPKLIATCSIINPLIRIKRIPNSMQTDDFSQISFGFENIVFDINGDYTELNDLPAFLILY